MSKLNMYICKKCNLLLINLGEQVSSSNERQIDSDGNYVLTDEMGSDVDHYFCPKCHGTDEYDGEDKTLEEMEFPLEMFKPMMSLWEKLRGIYDGTSPEFWEKGLNFGIPMDNKELKEIIFEHLV